MAAVKGTWEMNMLVSRFAVDSIRKAFIALEPTKATKFECLIRELSDNLRVRFAKALEIVILIYTLNKFLYMCEKSLMESMQETLKKYEIVANDKVVTSLEVLWEAIRTSLEYDDDSDFTMWEKKGKKSIGKFITYRTARSNYITPLHNSARKTNKHWKEVDFEDFCKHGGLKRSRKGRYEKQVSRLQSKTKAMSNHLALTSGVLEQVCEELNQSVGSSHRSLNARKLTKGVRIIQELYKATKTFMKENDITTTKCNTNIF